jgi:hypothetical protein
VQIKKMGQGGIGAGAGTRINAGAGKKWARIGARKAFAEPSVLEWTVAINSTKCSDSGVQSLVNQLIKCCSLLYSTDGFTTSPPLLFRTTVCMTILLPILFFSPKCIR